MAAYIESPVTMASIAKNPFVTNSSSRPKNASTKDYKTHIEESKAINIIKTDIQMVVNIIRSFLKNVIDNI